MVGFIEWAQCDEDFAWADVVDASPTIVPVASETNIQI